MIDVVIEEEEVKLKWSKFRDLYGGNNDTWIGSVDFFPTSYEIYKKSSTNYVVTELGSKGSRWSLGWAKTLADAKQIADKAFDKLRSTLKK